MRQRETCCASLSHEEEISIVSSLITRNYTAQAVRTLAIASASSACDNLYFPALFVNLQVCSTSTIARTFPVGRRRAAGNRDCAVYTLHTLRCAQLTTQSFTQCQ